MAGYGYDLFGDDEDMQIFDFLSNHITDTITHLDEITDLFENDILRKDVYWQNSAVVTPGCVSEAGSSTSSSLSSPPPSSTADNENINSLFDSVFNNTSTREEQICPKENFSNNSDFQDNKSCASDDSLESINSIDDSTYTPPSSSPKQKHKKSSSRKKIDPIYCNDPYLQRHRLLVNARQKNRMLKINKMYTMLNELIPENTPCEETVKPESKLGILKRAITYWNSLQMILQNTTPGLTETDTSANVK